MVGRPGVESPSRGDPPTCSAMFSTFFRSMGRVSPTSTRGSTSETPERERSGRRERGAPPTWAAVSARRRESARLPLRPPDGSSTWKAASSGEPYSFGPGLYNPRCSTNSDAVAAYEVRLAPQPLSDGWVTENPSQILVRGLVNSPCGWALAVVRTRHPPDIGTLADQDLLLSVASVDAAHLTARPTSLPPQLEVILDAARLVAEKAALVPLSLALRAHWRQLYYLHYQLVLQAGAATSGSAAHRRLSALRPTTCRSPHATQKVAKFAEGLSVQETFVRSSRYTSALVAESIPRPVSRDSLSWGASAARLERASARRNVRPCVVPTPAVGMS